MHFVKKTRNFGEFFIVDDVEGRIVPVFFYHVAIYYIAGIVVNVSDVRCAMQSSCNDYM